MTVGAGNRHVSASERISGLTVLRYGVSRAVPVDDRMAVLALIFVRRTGELIVVGIFVAIGAERELDLIDGVFAGWEVTFVTFHLDVRAFKRIFRIVVLFHAERRRFPAVHIVAFLASALFRALIELPFVWVRSVAILASLEGDLLFEIILDVTRGAGHGGVLAK